MCHHIDLLRNKQDWPIAREEPKDAMANAGFGRENSLKCPRCGRIYSEPGVVICPSFEVGLIRAGDLPPIAGELPQMAGATTLKVRVSPIIGEALASVKPGEDFDEALLRALKARYPEQATSLLSAIARMIEVEGKSANEDRQQTLQRLAQMDPGPEITLTTSAGEPTRITAETRVIRIGDKEYHSMEEVPLRLRAMIEKAMSGKPTVRRAGCFSTLVAGWLLAILRGAAK